MKFIGRQVQFPKRKKLIKVDIHNNPLPDQEPIYVIMENHEGIVYQPGTPITSDDLNKGNWIDNKSIEFAKMDTDELPPPKVNGTQMVTKSNGETWIIPPMGQGDPKEVTNPEGSVIKVGGIRANIEFDSEPQKQIRSTRNIAETALENAVVAQGTANLKANRTDLDQHISDSRLHLGTGSVDRSFPPSPTDSTVPSTKLVKDSLDTKANLANGKTAHPLEIRPSSWQTAFANLSNDGVCFIRDVQSSYGNPFPELPPAQQVLVQITKSAAFSKMDLSTVTSGMSLHSTVSYINGVWENWRRPKTWLTTYDCIDIRNSNGIPFTNGYVVMNTSELFGGPAKDGDTFRITVNDPRQNSVSTHVIHYEIGGEAEFMMLPSHQQLDNSGFISRMMFNRSNELRTVTAHAWSISISTSNSKWYPESIFRIVRIEREIYI